MDCKTPKKFTASVQASTATEHTRFRLWAAHATHSANLLIYLNLVCTPEYIPLMLLELSEDGDLHHERSIPLC